MRRKSLRDQVIVITGATSGNGLAIAERAVREGAAVVVVARNEQALSDIRDRLTASGGRVATLAVDVADDGAAEQVVGAAVDAFGGFDSWVNNAGTGTYGGIAMQFYVDTMTGPTMRGKRLKKHLQAAGYDVKLTSAID
ncbi:SDR family NAD(P)-dependent oxidoreductase [Aureimonas sp. SK2]|uniref:SDR family NAD(P)-dependent oxidoreductase n=1 Tax=Aureimonas sp. SK2 TaxID=3015992 RepID=UPI002444C28E|nr:SDR family NAD(P)-dependent oxidoreductase [Aureimonas sp. SK2]